MAISNVNAFLPGASGADDTSRVPVKTLGQNDFLKLLVTELTTQDPLNPRRDAEFIAQMAQFSALEQTRDLSRKMDQLEGVQQLSTAAGLLGRTVQVRTGGNTPTQGLVSEVRMFEGSPGLVVDGKVYPLDQVSSVLPAAPGAAAAKPGDAPASSPNSTTAAKHSVKRK